MGGKLRLFISYATEDRFLADQIFAILRHKFGKEKIEVFLDREAIKPGGEIAETIREQLTLADVLIVVSTGVSKSSHSWPGFELGFFEGRHEEDGQRDGIRGTVATICLDNSNTVPGPNKTKKYISLGMGASLLDKTIEEFEKELEVEDRDDFLVFLGEILEALEKVQLSKVRDRLEEFKEAIREFKVEVFKELKKKVKEVRKPQKQLLIRYNNSKVDRRRLLLPADTKLISVGGAIGVFRLNADEMSEALITTVAGGMGGRVVPTEVSGKEILWADFCENIRKSPLGLSWCAALSKIVISSSEETVDDDCSQIIASWDRKRLYRLVPTTSTTFYNDDVEVSLYLVEISPGRDYGNEQTTLLLKGLHLVCRFRFLFLEATSTFRHEVIRLEKSLPEKARQLTSELDLLQNEAVQAHLDKPEVFGNIIDLGKIEAMTLAWRPMEEKIRQMCGRAISEAGDPVQLDVIRVELANQLKELEDKMSCHNSELIRAMATKLADLTVAERPLART